MSDGTIDRFELADGDVRVELGDDFVGTVELNRPPANYFDVVLIGAIADAYERLDGDDRCRSILLCAEGRHFCAGADFTTGSASPSTAWEPADLYREAARLVECATPVVAAVQGSAIGGGLGLACTADLRVGTAETRFVANFARLGIHQGFGLTATLPAIVGPQHARRLLLTAAPVRGDEALAIGLCDQVVPVGDLRAAARAVAGELTAVAPLAVRSIKRTLDRDRLERFRAATSLELAEQRVHFETRDFVEGVRAAGERRTPSFEGR